MDKRLPVLCDDAHCTGCSACANVCSVDAIALIRNEEGFYRPAIDTEKCIGCLQCERKCPVLCEHVAEESMARVYAAWHKDVTIRGESSSGGAFSALAETVLNEGGVVVGAAYTADLLVEHICVTDQKDLFKLRLSKYVQSRIGSIFKEISTYLGEGRTVLFCGTPCQVAGLRTYIGKECEHLICCDFICHGVPSPLMMEGYLTWLKDKYGAISHINFRDKRKGWYDALRVVTLNTRKKVILKGRKDSFWVGFSNNNNLQNSCYDCRFLGFRRGADITIADFWGIGRQKPFGYKEEIEKGISMLMANSEKGLSLIRESADNMMLIERDKDEVITRNQSILHSSKRPESRDAFYQDLKSLSFDEMIQKHLDPGSKTKLVKFMREYLPYSIIAFIRTKNQK